MGQKHTADQKDLDKESDDITQYPPRTVQNQRMLKLLVLSPAACLWQNIERCGCVLCLLGATPATKAQADIHHNALIRGLVRTTETRQGGIT